MGETADQIVSDIERTREELKFNLQELEARAKAAADWHTHFERHTGAMVVAAAMGGALLALLLGGKR